MSDKFGELISSLLPIIQQKLQEVNIDIESENNDDKPNIGLSSLGNIFEQMFGDKKFIDNISNIAKDINMDDILESNTIDAIEDDIDRQNIDVIEETSPPTEDDNLEIEI